MLGGGMRALCAGGSGAGSGLCRVGRLGSWPSWGRIGGGLRGRLGDWGGRGSVRRRKWVHFRMGNGFILFELILKNGFVW
jgi:hypothetical protein